MIRLTGTLVGVDSSSSYGIHSSGAQWLFFYSPAWLFCPLWKHFVSINQIFWRLYTNECSRLKSHPETWQLSVRLFW